jgi:hypothetical protein
MARIRANLLPLSSASAARALKRAWVAQMAATDPAGGRRQGGFRSIGLDGLAPEFFDHKVPPRLDVLEIGRMEGSL